MEDPVAGAVNDAPRRLRDGTRGTAVFAAVAFAAAVAGIGVRGLWEPDEGRYAEAARGMLVSGDWLVPRLEGTEHLTKPPGAYWLFASGLAVLGTNAWGARIFVGVAFAATALLVRWAGTRLLDAGAGSRAGWVYLAMLFPFASSNVVSTDTFLAFATTLSAALLLRSWDSERPAAWLLAAGAAAGLGFLFKGPPSLLPLAGLGAGWLAGGARAHPDRRRCSVRGVFAGAGVVAVCLGIGLPWFAWLVAHRPELSDYFLGHEVIDRVTSTVHRRQNPWWIYGVVLVAGTIPFTAQVVRGVRALRGDPRLLLVAWWIGLPLAVFVAAQSRMWLYPLPLAAPLAVLAAAGARDPAARTPLRPAALAAWVVALVAARTGLAWKEDERDMLALSRAVLEASADTGEPIAVLTGRDAHGLRFYLGDRLTYLGTDEVFTRWSAASLDRFAAARSAEGRSWLLVSESDREADVDASDVQGDLEPHPAPVGWRLFRVRPETDGLR